LLNIQEVVVEIFEIVYEKFRGISEPLASSQWNARGGHPIKNERTKINQQKKDIQAAYNTAAEVADYVPEPEAARVDFVNTFPEI
jgi:hypothetical protein